MNSAFTAAQAWAVVLGLGLPLFVLWWWARRNAPLSGDQRDYSVGYRTAEPEPAAHAAGLAEAPHTPVAMPEGMVDAPILANPAHLEPPTAVAAPPASIAAEPLPAAALPPEPAGAELHPMPSPEPVAAAPAAIAAPAQPPAAIVPEPAPAATPVMPATPSVEPPPPAPKIAAASVMETTAAPVPPAAEASPLAAKPVPTAITLPEPAVDAKTATPAHVMAATETPSAAPAAAVAAAPAAPSGADDDLSRILNVTPQIVEILHGAGIHTYRELAAADVAHLRQLLEAASLSAVDPSTWPQQGRFAAGGKWKQLQNLQNRLAAV
ncbi:MAG: helix-hairpin-helix domain-containing protein [Anaerolineales bacterium]